MMKEIRTQSEFDAAIETGEREFAVVGDCTLVVTTADELLLFVSGSSRPRVEARESSQPRVVARESSQPSVVARESSQPRVVAWGSSQPRVEAWESSQPSVVANGCVQLAVSGQTIVTAGPHVAVLLDGGSPQVTGGQQTVTQRSSIEQWCVYYGVCLIDGIVTLYKAVDDDYRSPHGALYTPGTMPVAPDWDGGREECGGGFHGCAHSQIARTYNMKATRYVACQVSITDLVLHPNATMPSKVKFRAVCQPIYEVDEDGERVDSAATALEARP